MKFALKILIVILPWKIRRFLLIRFFNYEIHPTAKIKFAFFYPRNLVMKEGSVVDHFTVAINLDSVILQAFSGIGRNNWITGTSSGTDSAHFKHQDKRKSEFYLGEHSFVTKNHHLDCTNTISVGRFSTIAGYRSQFLTHSIDIQQNIQDSFPINIGDYCFVGTNSVILGGANLPNYSVLGAKSVLNKSFSHEYRLYGGVPAKEIKPLAKDSKYFHRTVGIVI